MNSLSAYTVVQQTLWILLPEFVLILTALAMMTAGAFVRRPRGTWSLIAALALGAALIALIAVWDRSTDLYSAVALNDAFSRNSRLFLLLTGLIVLGLAHDQVDDARAAEYFGALLIIDAGAMLVAAANEMVLLFVALELVSMPTYLLLYLSRRDETTLEAATKYFFLSVFSSALLLYGLAFLYGTTGDSNLKALTYFAHYLPSVPLWQMGLISVIFIMAGLGFRVAAVPFHFYAPDVYQGSPTLIAAVLAWFPKGVGFLAILRTLATIIPAAGRDNPVFNKAIVIAWVLAAVTMTLGNTVALLQNNLKRLLAYSAIAHAGYLMIGVAVAFTNQPSSSEFVLGSEGVLFYLAAYALMTLGAFGVIISLSTHERPVETIDDLAGLSRTSPVLALVMAVCLFSLAGIPPLAGFWGKLWIFVAALSAYRSDWAFFFQLLVVIGVLNAAIGAYYYLRIVVAMYFRTVGESESIPRRRAGWPTLAAIAASAGLTVIIGFFPKPAIRAARAAAEASLAYPNPSRGKQAVDAEPSKTKAPNLKGNRLKPAFRRGQVEAPSK